MRWPCSVLSGREGIRGCRSGPRAESRGRLSGCKPPKAAAEEALLPASRPPPLACQSAARSVLAQAKLWAHTAVRCTRTACGALYSPAQAHSRAGPPAAAMTFLRKDALLLPWLKSACLSRACGHPQGPGPAAAHRQHQPHHEACTAGQCQDCKRCQGDGAGVPVRVHLLHHQRVSMCSEGGRGPGACVRLSWTVLIRVSGHQRPKRCTGRGGTKPAFRSGQEERGQERPIRKHADCQPVVAYSGASN